MKIDTPKINNLTSNGFVKTKTSDGSLEVDTSSYQKELVCVSKTANYTANPNELVNCDVSGGSFKVTLPSAPADKTVIYVKLNAIGTNKYLTIATGGTDKFNTPTGTVEIYMYLFGEYAQMQYCSDTGLWTTFISAGTYNFANQNPGVDASTPITNADISIDTATRVLTITPPLGYFNIFSDGGGIITRYRKVGTINFPAFTDTSGMWYFYFDATGTAVTTQTPWTVADFPSIIPMYRVVWNATLYSFTVTAANATVGATYTNNSVTYTVLGTIAGGTTLKLSGVGDPEASGTLTKASGTGDATITFSAFSSADKKVAEYIEYHLNDIPADTHTWFHLQGAQWVTGFTMANNALVSGIPNADGRNAVVALTTGANVDDNLEYSVTNDATPTEPWQQDLGNTTPATLNATNSALFKVFVRDVAGLYSFLPATRFPFHFNPATNTPLFIKSDGTTEGVTGGDWFVTFIYATQNPIAGEAIKVVSATNDFTTLTNARAFNWTDIQAVYPILADGETRPLYRLIYQYNVGYDVGTKKSALRETQDLRKAAVTSTTAATGSLPASSVTFVPYDGIGSTNVQSAISELADERLNLDQTVSQTITAGQPIQDTLTASELVATDASKKLSSLAVATYPSLTEVSYVKGVTSGIQSQLNGKQASLGFTPEDVANKDTTITLGTSDIKYPSQNAVKVYVDNILGNANALVYKGVIDCGTNPNYPAADAGHLYIVSVAGKIGGASGIEVEVGDMAICNTDSTISGDQATVGTYWNVIQKNIIGAVTGPASAVADNIAVFDSTTGKIIKDGGAKIVDFVTKALYDANSILYATTDNTPIALTVGEQTVVGRTTGGAIAALAIDSDLSSVSANDDTVPSAKATKTALDLKSTSASPTFSGTITLGDNTRTDLTLPTADGYVTGPTTDSFASGYSSAAGDLVFFGSGGKWLEVDADAVATCKGLIGIALEAKTDTQAMKVALPGSMVRFDAWNWTVGATLYAGETLGAMQETIPTGADAIIKVVGFAVNADTIFFNPSPDQQSTVA